jgi:hypothetical protein
MSEILAALSVKINRDETSPAIKKLNKKILELTF